MAANVYKINGNGLRIPIVAGDPASPENGMMWYNSSLGLFRKHENGSTTDIGSGGSTAAADVTYDNSSSSLAATDVQAAIDEVEARLDTAESSITTINSDIGNIEGDIADLVTLSGVAANATHLGTFTGATIADSSTVKSALQDLETAVELRALDSVVTEIDGNVNDLITLTGVAENAMDLGTFSGSTISNATTIKSALQELETAVELRALDSDVIKKDGSVAYTADQSFGGFKATNLADPAANGDAVTLGYMNARLAVIKPKTAVRVASTANVVIASALENGDTLDGVTLATGDRVLLKDQSTASQNGIYVVVASGAASRATDFDSVTPIDEINGAWVSVQEGTANAGKIFVQFGTVTTVGTDAINFEYFNPIAGLIGGDMITFSGSTFSVDLATTSGLESTNAGNAAGQLRVKLEATDPSLRITGSNELAVKFDGAGAITSGASGIKVGVDNSTVEISSNALRIKDASITNAKVATGIDAAKLADGSVSNAEFQYLGNVTSDIQTQLNGKLTSIVQDTTPELGGDLDLAGFAIGDQTDTDGPSMKLGDSTDFVKTTYLHAVGLTASQTNNAGQAILAFDHTVYGGQIIEYRIKEATTNRMRVGTLYITSNGTDTAITDQFTETADVGVTWNLNISGSTTQVRYTTTANNKTMHCTVKRFLV
jgi:hypothetical protein